MKNIKYLIAALLLISFTGCYTQFGSADEDYGYYDDYGYEDQGDEYFDDTAIYDDQEADTTYYEYEEPSDNVTNIYLGSDYDDIYISRPYRHYIFWNDYFPYFAGITFGYYAHYYNDWMYARPYYYNHYYNPWNHYYGGHYYHDYGYHGWNGGSYLSDTKYRRYDRISTRTNMGYRNPGRDSFGERTRTISRTDGFNGNTRTGRTIETGRTKSDLNELTAGRTRVGTTSGTVSKTTRKTTTQEKQNKPAVVRKRSSDYRDKVVNRKATGNSNTKITRARTSSGSKISTRQTGNRSAVKSGSDRTLRVPKKLPKISSRTRSSISSGKSSSSSDSKYRSSQSKSSNSSYGSSSSGSSKSSGYTRSSSGSSKSSATRSSGSSSRSSSVSRSSSGSSSSSGSRSSSSSSSSSSRSSSSSSGSSRSRR